MSKNLLKINNLKTYFFTDAGTVKAVEGINLKIAEGETLGLVGESGCGKSVTALSILRLLPSPPGKIVEGNIEFKGKDLLTLDEGRMRQIRGKDISMIFQEPMTSLNPVFTIGDQIMEAIIVHEKMSRAETRKWMLQLLKIVGMPAPRERFRSYPHQLSGGMRQRAMIAMALSCHPSLLIADEPTTALDVTIQAQILNLLKDLQKKFGMSILLITHDLGVIAEMADRVVIMYAGRIVESAPVGKLFAEPRHPYTQGLLKCLPHLELDQVRLDVIEGQVPDLIDLPPGCSFQSRCQFREKRCLQEFPSLREVEEGHYVACYIKTGTKAQSSKGTKKK
ncbi:MAG: ABC transporter ATP-binding protein [Nitrospirae bacterium]|nr:ABC transporter ATP-binding protein [Nitrospirota bacterium]